jgi:hypothetical protein
MPAILWPLETGTQLSITPITPATASFGIQYFSGRRIKQSLDEIAPVSPEATLQRSGNGNFINFSRPQFQKLRSVVTYNDLRSVLLNGSWRGSTVLVNCAIYRWRSSTQTADRPIVPGSTTRSGANGEVGFLPQLTMTVKDATCIFDEWLNTYRGTIIMEE